MVFYNTHLPCSMDCYLLLSEFKTMYSPLPRTAKQISNLGPNTVRTLLFSKTTSTQNSPRLTTLFKSEALLRLQSVTKSKELCLGKFRVLNFYVFLINLAPPTSPSQPLYMCYIWRFFRDFKFWIIYWKILLKRHNQKDCRQCNAERAVVFLSCP